MSSDPMAAPRCTANSKQTGERCKQRPIPGGTVCRFHGGRAPQTVAAAEQRQVEAAAAEAVEKLVWRGLAGADPVKDPVDLLARVAAVLEHATDVVGRRVNDLNDRVGAGEHLTQLRAEVVLLEKLLGHLRAVATDLARLGLAERHVQLEQARAEMVTSAFLAALEVAGLVPEVRSQVVERFLGGLTVTGAAAGPALQLEGPTP